MIDTAALPFEPDKPDQDPERRARTAIARLELVSHGTISNYDGLVRAGDDKPSRPAGGIGYASRNVDDGHRGSDDAQSDFPQKSHAHFVRRLRTCHVASDYERVAADAETALWAWQHTPIPTAPELSHPQWKQWVARTDLPTKEIVRRYGVTRQWVNRIRQQYRKSEVITQAPRAIRIGSVFNTDDWDLDQDEIRAA